MIQQFFRNRFGLTRNESSSNLQGGRGQGRGACAGGGGRGGGNKPSSGPGGNCVCPKCGHKEPHVAGKRCYDQTCPKCGTRMTRE